VFTGFFRFPRRSSQACFPKIEIKLFITEPREKQNSDFKNLDESIHSTAQLPRLFIRHP
jgi:hypothetical protein